MLSSPPPPSSGWSLYLSFFMRAVGLKRGFRRTGPSTLVNLAFAAGVGIVSGTFVTVVDVFFRLLASRVVGVLLHISHNSHNSPCRTRTLLYPLLSWLLTYTYLSISTRTLHF